MHISPSILFLFLKVSQGTLLSAPLLLFSAASFVPKLISAPRTERGLAAVARRPCLRGGPRWLVRAWSGPPVAAHLPGNRTQAQGCLCWKITHFVKQKNGAEKCSQGRASAGDPRVSENVEGRVNFPQVPTNRLRLQFRDQTRTEGHTSRRRGPAYRGLGRWVRSSGYRYLGP